MKTSTNTATKTNLTKQLLSNDYVEQMKKNHTQLHQNKEQVREKLSVAYDRARETQGRVSSVCKSDLSSQNHTKSLLENCEALLKMTASALKTIQSNPKYQVINA
jgi:hypothetical protein